MSKMGNFVIDMHVDAARMTLEEFENKYGNHNRWVYTQYRYGENTEPDPEPYCYPGSDPQV